MLIKRMIPNEGRIKPLALTVKDFYQKRNNILIIRNSRGIGDILMHRMIFEDFKKIMPDAYITFACWKEYYELMQNHPFVDELVDARTVDRAKYVISYDTSKCCIRRECQTAPFADAHRADIWAEHCGVKLTSHNMHAPFISNELIQFGHFRVKQLRAASFKLCEKDGPNVLFNPFAFDKLRTLTDRQVVGVVEYLRKRGVFVFAVHSTRSPLLEHLNVPMITGLATSEWLSVIHAADYVVTVDTSTFHYAGGINKPMTGIFTHADGKFRGKYYDFILVQKHRDNGDWPCGPCYNHTTCSHPKCANPTAINEAKPCLTELTIKEITDGIEKMFVKWQK